MWQPHIKTCESAKPKIIHPPSAIQDTTHLIVHIALRGENQFNLHMNLIPNCKQCLIYWSEQHEGIVTHFTTLTVCDPSVYTHRLPPEAREHLRKPQQESVWCSRWRRRIMSRAQWKPNTPSSKDPSQCQAWTWYLSLRTWPLTKTAHAGDEWIFEHFKKLTIEPSNPNHF